MATAPRCRASPPSQAPEHSSLKVLGAGAEALDMRQAINENRTVQLAILGVLALFGGLFLLKGMGGGDSSAATSTAAPATAATDPATGAPSTAAPVTDPATGAALPTAAPSAASGTGVPANLIPGPGLPKGLMPAYKHGKAIVLLVRRAGGTDDAFVHASVDGLRALPNVKVYVTKAKGIARYAWLTQGVNVTDLPAIVVLRPRKLTKGKAVATVSYGFRNANSVLQTVKDAVYRGPENWPYHP
jgi:hypothetical protein